MAFPIALLAQLPVIISGVVKLVDTVEGLVRKPKAGAEKKEMVLDSILGDILDDANTAEGATVVDGSFGDGDGYIPSKLLFFDGKYNWSCLITKIPKLRVAIGALIDAIVKLKNVLAECDE